MKSEVDRIRQLTLVQITHLAIFALIPIPLILLYNFLKVKPPIGAWYFGLEQFLEATFAELILAIASLCLLIKVCRMGSKWSARSKKIIYWSCGISVLILYVANVNILIILPCLITANGFVNLVLAQKRIGAQTQSLKPR